MTRRFIRPSTPRSGVHLGVRDHRLLELVGRFRYLAAEQLRTLIAPATARRVFQRRLRLLFEHGLLERRPLPPTTNNRRHGVPLYSLGDGGEAALGERASRLPARPTTGLPSTIHHGLAATDFLVAIHAALRSRPGGPQTTLHPEAELWRALARWRLQSHRRRPAIVPDGAVTVTEGGRVGSTYALEVVRADIRGGSRTFIAKLVRYGELVRARFFREAFGFERLRAVVVATPSATRARHLRELAAKAPITVPVLFTAFASGSRAFTAESVTGPVFADRAGAPFAIVPAVCS